MDISVSMLGSLTSLSAGFDSPSSGTAQERGAVARAAAKINASGLLGADLEVSLAIDAQTRRPIVRVVDAVTHDVIEQIPPRAVASAGSATPSAQREEIGSPSKRIRE